MSTSNRELMERYWAAAEADDVEAMHNIRAQAFVVDFPQTGEQLAGRDTVRAFEEGQESGPSFVLDRLTGEGKIWVAEGRMRSGSEVTYIVSISELEDGRIARSTEYFATPLPSMVPGVPADSSRE